MLRALRIAWALIRVPNLTQHLFLLPIVLSLLLVVGQLITTGLFLGAASQSAMWRDGDDVKEDVADTSPVRYLLYGSGERRGPLRICRWVPDPNRPMKEIPQSVDCKAERLDVAINVSNPDTFVVDEYVSIFQGQIDRLHVCKHCAPDAIIRVGDEGDVQTMSYSMWGMAVLSLAYLPREAQRTERLDTLQATSERLGSLSLYMPESRRLIDITPANPGVAFTLNVVPMIIIALWLAVRAHGKVLEYFAQNNVLLPLVAATGKRAFYGALWILTSARVGCFLAASIPIVYFGLQGLSGEDGSLGLAGRTWLLVCWFVAVIPAVGLSTMIASVADLKRRHSMANFLYRYVPILLALVGGAAWAFTFVFPTETAGIVRTIFTALPVVGLAPVFIAPVTEPPYVALLFHGTVSLVALVFLVRVNMRWFAAHLEEV